MNQIKVIKEFLFSYAVSQALLSASLMVPGAGALFFAASPQPVLRLCVRSRWISAVAVLVATTATSGFLLGWIVALSYFLILGVSSVCHGFLLRAGWTTDRALLMPAAIYASATAVVVFLLHGTAVLSSLHAHLTEAMRASLVLHEQIFSNSESLNTFKRQLPMLVDRVIDMLPALTFIGIGIIGFGNVLLLRSRWNRQPHGMLLEDLKQWRTPEHLVWLLIASGYALVVPFSAVRTAALNLLIILISLYFFQGIAVLSHFFHKKGVPPFFQILGYGLIALEQFLALAVAGIGLFDLWRDFRGLKAPGPASERKTDD